MDEFFQIAREAPEERKKLEEAHIRAKLSAIAARQKKTKATKTAKIYEEKVELANKVLFIIEHIDTYKKVAEYITGNEISQPDKVYIDFYHMLTICATIASIYYSSLPIIKIAVLDNALTHYLESYDGLPEFENHYANCGLKTMQKAFSDILFVSPTAPFAVTIIAIDFAACIKGDEEASVALSAIKGLVTTSLLKKITFFVETAQEASDLYNEYKDEQQINTAGDINSDIEEL